MREKETRESRGAQVITVKMNRGGLLRNNCGTNLDGFLKARGSRLFRMTGLLLCHVVGVCTWWVGSVLRTCGCQVSGGQLDCQSTDNMRDSKFSGVDSVTWFRTILLFFFLGGYIIYLTFFLFCPNDANAWTLPPLILF